MTKAQIEEQLKEVLSHPFSTMFFRDGQFVIYSPVGRTHCSGAGSTIQLALFAYDVQLARLIKKGVVGQ